MTWADLDPEKIETPWANLDPQIRAIAEEVCTEKELVALKFWHAEWGYRQMAPLLGLTAWETARDRVQRALKKMGKRKEELDKEERREADAA